MWECSVTKNNGGVYGNAPCKQAVFFSVFETIELMWWYLIFLCNSCVKCWVSLDHLLLFYMLIYLYNAFRQLFENTQHSIRIKITSTILIQISQCFFFFLHTLNISL